MCRFDTNMFSFCEKSVVCQVCIRFGTPGSSSPSRRGCSLINAEIRHQFSVTMRLRRYHGCVVPHWSRDCDPQAGIDSFWYTETLFDIPPRNRLRDPSPGGSRKIANPTPLPEPGHRLISAEKQQIGRRLQPKKGDERRPSAPLIFRISCLVWMIESLSKSGRNMN